MRILLHDYAGHAFTIQLSRALARRGHTLSHLYYAGNNTPQGRLQPQPGDPPGLEIAAIHTRKAVQKYSFVRRWLQEMEYGAALAQQISARRPQVVISTNTPLDTQKWAFDRCRRLGIAFVFWLQDLSSLAAAAVLKKRLPGLGAGIARYHSHLERSMLRGSQRVVAITEDFLAPLRRWGVPEARLQVIHNWGPLDEISPQPRLNAWSHRHALDGCFTFLYSGNMGMKHNPDLIVMLARRFQAYNNVRVIVNSEGLGATSLKLQVKDLGITNLHINPYQAFDQLPQVLASADVLVALLEPAAGIYSAPSKVLGYMCAQRPVLLAAPLQNLSARLVTDNHAGLAVAPDDPEGFLQAAESLYRDGALRSELGKNGRAFAERAFNINGITDRFEAVLEGL